MACINVSYSFSFKVLRPTLDDDTLVFFDFRSDRMREIVETMGYDKKHFETDTVRKGLVRHFPAMVSTVARGPINPMSTPACPASCMQHITTMTQYKATFPFPVVFPQQSMDNVLADWLAKQKMRQYHVAGTNPAATVSKCLEPGQRDTSHWIAFDTLQRLKNTRTSPSSSTAARKRSTCWRTARWCPRPRCPPTTRSLT